MKINLLTFTSAILFGLGAVVSNSYANPEEGGGEHAHMMGDHDMAHMGHMSDVLKTLKSEIGDKYDEPVPAATKAQLVSGKAIFMKSCTVCHGEGGKGDGPASAALPQKPADFTDSEHSKFYSDQGRLHIIRNGVAGTVMAGWKGSLSEMDIHAVHAYVRSLRVPLAEGHAAHSEHGGDLKH